MAIFFNESKINDWNYGSDNIVKVYRNNAVCYYKITGGGDTPTAQTPCFAVVNDISQYSYTEFVDVYNKADGKWYKLNNLNQYEEYGVYGSGRNITYYEGKLTIDDGYEYEWNGSSWVNLGEVSGSTASLPDVPFTVNFNAKNYDSQTKTLLKTSGQLADVDAVITAGTPTVNDGYLTIASGTRATISGYQTYFNRTNSAPNLTIISKQRTDGSNCHMFANRDSNYNWMYRAYDAYLSFNGSSQVQGTNTTTQPVIESVRVDSNRLLTFNNYTDNTSKTSASFKYGSTNSGNFAMFQGYATRTGEDFVGDFYWVYMSQNTLTDDQVQQVIAYNEGGGGEPEYPVYYDEIQDPPNNLTFSSMTEAEDYECPWVGMNATINGDKYVFSGDSQSGYEWVEDTDHYLPDMPYSFNYNAKQYIASTYTIPQTEGQLQNVDAVCNYGYKIVDHSADGYISVTGNSRMILSGNNGTYLNRSNTQANCPMTIISKAKTTSGYSIFTDRNSSSRQYMYRQDKTYAYLCGTGNTSLDSCICSDSIPSILSVRVYYDSGIKAKWNNWTTSASSTPEEYAYNNQSLTNGGALFCDYSNSNSEFWQGDFYWIYMSQNVLTDEQIQQVIDYNENL